MVGVGVRPENRLAVAAGLEAGPGGGIRVNEQLQTSDPDIYAVGDAIEVKNFVTGQGRRFPWPGQLIAKAGWPPITFSAARCGFRGTQGTAIVGVFNATAGITGASEKLLRRAGRPWRKVYVHPAQHAGYYPGAEGMTLKLLFDPH